MKLLRKFPFHPFFLALFPALSLAAANKNVITSLDVLRPITFSLLLSGILYGALTLATHNIHRSAICTSLTLLLFFSFGRAYALLAIRFDTTLWLLACWLLIFLLGLHWARTRLKNPTPATQLLNSICLLLLLSPFVTLALQRAADSTSSHEVACELPPPPITRPINKSPDAEFPDIYYIILDGYARADTLARLYDFDNSSLIAFLQEKGFYIATESTSNYNQTLLSLPSSLNMAYIQDLVCTEQEAAFDYWHQVELTHHNRVFDLAKEAGYALVTFSSGHSLTEIRSAEHYLRLARSAELQFTPSIELLGLPFYLNPFEILFLDTTLLRPLMPMLLSHGEEDPRFQAQRDRINFAFTHLADFAQADGAHLVFAHIVAPHPPFVFQADGTSRLNWRPYAIYDGSHWIGSIGTRPAYIDGYREQIQYVNLRLMQAIEDILYRSDPPPVIIIQADHGPGAYFDWQSLWKTDQGERMSILNAYYLPEQETGKLYPSITPVNSFRLLFNQVLEQEFELLEDRAYFSAWSTPFGFTEITEELSQPAEP